MKTQIFKIDSNNINETLINEAGAILRRGGLVAFPTETVYGLGANALIPVAVKATFTAKGRPSDNPLIVHIADKSDILKIARDFPPDAVRLIDTFSPGPLTVILKKQPSIDDAVTAGLDTVAVRIPSHPVARALIKAAGVPVTAPSANLSGKPSPTNAKHVIDDMDGRIDAVIDGGECEVGVESTVVDMSGEIPVILRPGGITPEQLRAVLPNVQLDRHITEAVSVNDTPKCPGMKYKHYAPDAEVTVIEGERGAVRVKICELLEKACAEGKRTGVMTMSDTDYCADLVLHAGSDNKEFAKNMFTQLRTFDENGIDVVFAEFFETDGLALAVRNRLYKSAANRVIRV